MEVIKKILGSVAPFLGSLIGGPLGAAAGKVVGNVLLGNEDASTAEIERALASASPEDLVRLREIDAEYKARMAEVGIDEQKIAAMDRDSARKREIEVKDIMPAVLAVLLTIGFFGVLAALMIHSIPPTTKDVIQVMLGALGTAWISTVTYYFGSSLGSNLKTRVMGEKIMRT